MTAARAIASVTASWAVIADARPECACGCGRDAAAVDTLAEPCLDALCDLLFEGDLEARRTGRPSPLTAQFAAAFLALPAAAQRAFSPQARATAEAALDARDGATPADTAARGDAP